MSVNMQAGLNSDLSVPTQNLGGPGFISQASAMEAAGNIQTLNQLRNEMIDNMKSRLGASMVDVELDKEDYELAIKRSLQVYRQRSSNAVEESYVFLDLLPETQEYILPNNIMEVRQCYRRGISSVTGTTATQFEPFASGYLNTYMLQSGRVGGLASYEMFAQYQKQAMTMFGGYMNFNWNRVTKKLTIMRKIPQYGHTYLPLGDITASGTAIGSTVTVTTRQPQQLSVGNRVYISNCPVGGMNGQYTISAVSDDSLQFEFLATATLDSTSVVGFNLSKTQIYSPELDGLNNFEGIMLHVHNHKPDSMLLSDPYALPWLQDWQLAEAKEMLGQGRGKFSTINGPQGGTQLNGAVLAQEAATEKARLLEDIKNYVDGGTAMWWVTG